MITSRNPGWHELATPIEVDVLERSESIALLLDRAPQLTDEQAEQIVDALGDPPGAVLCRSMPKAARVLAALMRDGWIETRRSGSPSPREG